MTRDPSPAWRWRRRSPRRGGDRRRCGSSPRALSRDEVRAPRTILSCSSARGDRARRRRKDADEQAARERAAAAMASKVWLRPRKPPREPPRTRTRTPVVFPRAASAMPAPARVSHLVDDWSRLRGLRGRLLEGNWRRRGVGECRLWLVSLRRGDPNGLFFGLVLWDDDPRMEGVRRRRGPQASAAGAAAAPPPRPMSSNPRRHRRLRLCLHPCSNPEASPVVSEWASLPGSWRRDGSG